MGVVTETLRVTGTDAAARGLKDVAVAADGASASVGKVQKGLTAAASQMPDVVTQLAGGANVFQVITQQGLQVAQQLGLVESAISGVGAAAGPVAIGIAALVAVGATLYNQYDRVADAIDTTTRSTEEIGSALVTARADVQSYATAWQGVLNALRDTGVEIAVINGQITAAQAKAQSQKAQLDADAQGRLLALGREVALTREAREANPTRENIAAQRAAEQALATAKAELQAAKDNIDAEAEYADALRASEEFLRRRAEAERKAAEAAKERQASLQSIIDMEDRFAAEERRRTEEADRARQEALDNYVANVQSIEEAKALLDKNMAEAAAAPDQAPGSTTASALLGQSVSAASGGLAQIAAMINPIVGAIAAAFLNLDNIVQGLKQQLAELPAQLVASPDLLAGLVVAAAQAMPALMEALPDVVSEMITALLAPETIAALAKIAIEGLLLTFGADPRLYIGIVNGLIDAIPQLVQAWIDALKNLPQELITGRREMRQRWGGLGDRFGGGGLNLQINGMVGDSWRLGNGIRSLFDRDFGRTGGRF